MMGNYKSVFRGRGLEFESYRNYTTEDDSILIDWKASVRTNDLFVKEFVEERNLNVFFLIDVSSSMVFGSTPKLKNDYAAELTSALYYAAVRASDAVGFALFNDKVTKKLYPSMGDKQYYIFLKNISNTINYGGKYNFINAIKFLMTYLKESSVVIIISDFIGLKGPWQHYLKIASSKFDLIGIMVRDPRDKVLPKINDYMVFSGPFSDTQTAVNIDKVRDKYRQYVARQEKMIHDEFVKANAGFLSLTTDKPFTKSLMDFFMRRARIVA